MLSILNRPQIAGQNRESGRIPNGYPILLFTPGEWFTVVYYYFARFFKKWYSFSFATKMFRKWIMWFSIRNWILHILKSHEKSHQIPWKKLSNSLIGQSNLARKNSWTVQRRLKRRPSRESNKNPLWIVSLYHIYLWWLGDGLLFYFGVHFCS